MYRGIVGFTAVTAIEKNVPSCSLFLSFVGICVYYCGSCQLRFLREKKFIYNILAELDEDFSGGIEFEEFLRIATAKISDKHSKKEIKLFFLIFDAHK